MVQGADPAPARPDSTAAVDPGERGQAMSTDRGPLQKQRVRLTTADLFRHQREIHIEHAGRIYRLRLTKSGKLILTA